MNRLDACILVHMVTRLPFSRRFPANAARLSSLLLAAALCGGCYNPAVKPVGDPSTEARITNDTATAVELELVFATNRLFGANQPEPAEVERRLAEFAVGEGVELLSSEPTVLINEGSEAIAGKYRIAPSGFMIVHSALGTEPHFEFSAISVTTEDAIEGTHTEEGVRALFKRGEGNRYEFKIGALNAPATPTHMTQAAFDETVNSARKELAAEGLQIIADHQGALATGKSHTESIPPLDPEWVHRVLVIGDGCFMKLDLRDQDGAPVFTFDQESSDDPSGPHAAFAPTPKLGYKVTIGMADCPDATCNYALLVLKSELRAPPQYPPLDMSQITIGPENTISWDDAKTMIKHGNVKYIAQLHSLHVDISLANGKSYQTKEPEIDAVLRWLEQCGKRDWVGVISE